MKRSALNAIFVPALLCAAFGAAAFSWPTSGLDSSKSVFTFSQNRKGRFCQSLLFEGAQDAKAADKGKIIAVIGERPGDGDWFEPALGNALIVRHEDSLISVYGNLSKESASALSKKRHVEDEEALGQTGTSAWSESGEEGGLEFQIADCASRTFINPMILMPRTIRPPKIALDGLAIENQFGRIYNLSSLRSVPAGVYKVYKKRQKDVNVYKSEVYVNGSELEKITKETIRMEDGRLALRGQRTYTSKDFYPNDELEFLGRVLLPHGSDTITIVAANIYDGSTTANFSLSAF